MLGIIILDTVLAYVAGYQPRPAAIMGYIMVERPPSLHPTPFEFDPTLSTHTHIYLSTPYNRGPWYFTV